MLLWMPESWAAVDQAVGGGLHYMAQTRRGASAAANGTWCLWSKGHVRGTKSVLACTEYLGTVQVFHVISYMAL